MLISYNTIILTPHDIVSSYTPLSQPTIMPSQEFYHPLLTDTYDAAHVSGIVSAMVDLSVSQIASALAIPFADAKALLVAHNPEYFSNREKYKVSQFDATDNRVTTAVSNGATLAAACKASCTSVTAYNNRQRKRAQS